MSAARTPTLQAGGFENGGFAYLEIGAGRKPKRIMAADAIAALNSHDALVAALEQIANAGSGTVPTNLRRSQMQAIASAALKAAKGEA